MITREECLTSARLFKKPNEWKSSEPRTYNAAFRNGWLAELTSHMVRSPRILPHIDGTLPVSPLTHSLVDTRERGEKWSPSACIEEAAKFETFAEWQKSSTSSVAAARRLGILTRCRAHMHTGRQNPVSKAECIKDAARHQTRTSWSASGGRSRVLYETARQKGWLDECCRHMKDGRRPTVGLDECLQEARKHQTPGAWKKADWRTYNAACRNSELGWKKLCDEAIHAKAAGTATRAGASAGNRRKTGGVKKSRSSERTKDSGRSKQSSPPSPRS